MKNSGIPWIGEIPEGWKVDILSVLFFEHKCKNIGMCEKNLLSLSYGNIIKKDINTSEGLLPESFETYNIIDKGDIIFRLTDLQNDKRSLRTGLCKEKGIITSAYVCLRKRSTNSSEYFHYLFHAYDICKVFYSYGGGVRQGMNYEDLRKMPIVFPPLSEQQAIADFLDKKCAEIDQMVALQEKFIEELKAYKQSLITETVTKGLNPNAKMKDSGVEWIGEIPEGWKVVRHKNIMHKNKEIQEVYAGQNILSLSTQGVIVRDLNAGGKMPVTFDGYQKVKKGNLLMCLFDMDVTPCCNGLILTDGVTSPAYSQFELCSDAYAPYYNLLFTALNTRKTLVHLSKNLRSSLTEDDFGLIPTILPPLSEQQAIADYLDKKCAEIDRLIAIKQKKADELKEYKKSIIYEYVTGKKDING